LNLFKPLEKQYSSIPKLENMKCAKIIINFFIINSKYPGFRD